MKRGIATTAQVIENSFTELGNEYCSLGQSKFYYQMLKRILTTNFTSFLLAFRDVSFFPRILEQFENEPTYKNSLIRNNEAERLVRTIRFEIEGIDFAL